MIKLLRFFNTLSLDTALGAVSIAFLLGHSSGNSVDLFTYAALFISVLAIYNFDHLFDALMLSDDSMSFRHSFYQRHFKGLLYWQLVLIIVGAVVIFYLPINILLAGLGMLMLIGLYFMLIIKSVKNNLIYRELFVALGYTLAVALAPIFSKNAVLNIEFWWTMFIVFLIALTNLWVISIYEWEIDEKENRHSIARSVEQISLKHLSRSLIIIAVLIISAYSFFYQLWLLGSILAIIELVYFILLEKQKRFSRNELYRLIGEAVFILPGLALLANVEF